MTARQLEIGAYVVLGIGLVGTWGFAHVALLRGTATVPGTIGLYLMTGLPFGLAAAGSRWARTNRYASGWLLAVWIVGLVASLLVLIGSRGELFGSLFVFMLPLLHSPAVVLAVLVAWLIRRVAPPRTDDA